MSESEETGRTAVTAETGTAIINNAEDIIPSMLMWWQDEQEEK